MNNLETVPQGGAEVLVTAKLLGRERSVGEVLTSSELEKIPARNLKALADQGVIALLGDKSRPKREPSPAEKRAKQAFGRARKRAAEAAETLKDVKAKLDAARKDVTDFAERRRPWALQAARGETDAQAELDKLREDQRRAEMAVGDLEVAVQQAEANVASADVEVVKAERRQREAEVKRLVDERMATARAIEDLAQPLAAAVRKYVRIGQQIGHVIGHSSNQLNNPWRLQAYLSHTLDIDYVEPDLRKPLTEFEGSVLRAVLKDEESEKEAA